MVAQPEAMPVDARVRYATGSGEVLDQKAMPQ